MRIEIPTGTRFTRLVVERWDPVRHRWVCHCDCGGEAFVARGNLVSGSTQSCGCLQRERTRAAHITHGHAGARPSGTYNSWSSMLRRCHSPQCPDFYLYGGRGITVCERWKSFENFLADMGVKPLGLSLDRRDSDGNYEPSNCRWATSAVQASNRRMHRARPESSDQTLARISLDLVSVNQEEA